MMRMKERTKDNEVYEDLRGRILRGQYQAGERLPEEKLCQEFGVTRTPLRLALRRLEHEGLLTGEPFCGVHVRDVRHDEVASLFDMREVLEGLAARTVAESGDAKVWKALRALASTADGHCDNERWAKYFAADKAFHWALIEHSNNPRLVEVMEVYNFQLRTFAFHDQRLRSVTDHIVAIKDTLVDQHIKLVDAIATGDGVAAENAVRSHVQGSKIMLLGIYETEAA